MLTGSWQARSFNKQYLFFIRRIVASAFFSTSQLQVLLTRHFFLPAGNAIGGNANSIGNNNAAMFNMWNGVMDGMKKNDKMKMMMANANRQLAGRFY